MPHLRVNPQDMYRRGGIPRWSSPPASHSGTSPARWGFNPAGALVGDNDMRAQAAAVMDNVRRALAAIGATPAHVVRITTYTTDMDRFRAEAGPVVFGFFGNTRLASTLLAETRLADPRHLLEVEATAVASPAS